MPETIEPVFVEVVVNGGTYQREVEPRMLVVEFLREELGLTGTHVGCDTSYCGACTGIMDGRPVKSCPVLAVQSDGCTIETVEGPSTIKREWYQRRITVSANVRGRDMVSFVEDAKRKIAEKVQLPPGRYSSRGPSTRRRQPFPLEVDYGSSWPTL